jgi:hypothetical protein
MKVIETTPIQSDARKSQASSFILAHRIFTLRFAVPGVNRSTAVAVSLTEVSGDQPFIGDATMKVYNVAPRDGGEVDVRGEIDWDTDLLVRVNFIF